MVRYERWIERDGPAGVAAPRDPAHRKVGTLAVDTTESSAPHAHPSTEDHDDLEAHYASLERMRPHACSEGLVFLTYTVFDEAVGDEVERIEAVPPLRG